MGLGKEEDELGDGVGDGATQRKGDEPGGENVAGDGPSDAANSSGGADTHEGGGDGVGGRKGDAKAGGDFDGQGGAGFGGEAVLGFEVSELGAHGFDDLPATNGGADTHDGGAEEDDPRGDVKLGNEPPQEEGEGKGAHKFLAVVAAVTESDKGGGEDLGVAEKVSDTADASIGEDEGDELEDGEGDGETKHGRKEQAEADFGPALPEERREAARGQGGAGEAGDEGVAFAGGEAKFPGEGAPEDDGDHGRGDGDQRDGVGVDDVAADGGGDGGTGEGADNVEGGGHDDGGFGGEDAGGNDGGDGVGGVGPAVDKLRPEDEEEDEEKDGSDGHLVNPPSRNSPSVSLWGVEREFRFGRIYALSEVWKLIPRS